MKAVGVLLIMLGAFVFIVGWCVVGFWDERSGGELVGVFLMAGVSVLAGVSLLVSANLGSNPEERLSQVDAKSQGEVTQLSDDELQAIVDRAAKVWGWPPDIDWRARERAAWRELVERRSPPRTPTVLPEERAVKELSDEELEEIVAQARRVWGWPPDVDWKPRDREAWQELERRKPAAARS